MRTICLIHLALPFCLMLCSSCGLVNSVSRTAGNILGVDQTPRVSEDAVVRNEYHAACIKAKQERIQAILKGDGQ